MVSFVLTVVVQSQLAILQNVYSKHEWRSGSKWVRQTKPTADVCNPGNLSAVRGKEEGDVERGKEKKRKNISPLLHSKSPGPLPEELLS